MSKLIEDRLRYLIFAELYQKFPEGKAQRKALSLIESAITCFARKGFENVTLEMIAREAGVTRPLLKHYFKDLQDIQIVSIKYVRLLFQKMAVEKMQASNSLSGSLENYILACFEWTQNCKTHAKVWLAYLLTCVSNSEKRQMNTIAVRTGEERIQTLLETGKARGEFHFDDAKQAAKAVQTLLTGALLTLASEDITNIDEYLSLIQRQSLAMVR